MIMDRQALLSSNQAITTGTAVSSNTYDLQQARDIGEVDMDIVVEVTAPFVGGTSLQVAYITSANADLSSPNVIVQTGPIALADLVLGAELLRIDIPALTRNADVQRYIGLQYTAVGTFTGGTVTAGIVMDRQLQRAYPSGLNVGGF